MLHLPLLPGMLPSSAKDPPSPCRWRWWCWRLCLRRWWAILAHVQEAVGVACLQARDVVHHGILQQIRQDCRGLLGWVYIKHQRSCARDMRASHRGATERPAAVVICMDSRDNISPRRPDVGAAAVIAEV